MKRKLVSLDRDTVLWEAGDATRSIAVVESGKLCARDGETLLGTIWPGMALGESALFAASGERRGATIVALEDGTTVAEYAASAVQECLADGDDTLSRLVIHTLLGQTCRNLLMVMTVRQGYPFMEAPLRGLVDGIAADAGLQQPIRSWDNFILTARFLYDLRDFSARALQVLGPDPAGRAEMVEQAAKMLENLFGGNAILPVLADFLNAERETTRRSAEEAE